MGIRNGATYLAALQDDREVWMTEEEGRVPDVTQHPLLGPLAKKIAENYDLQCDPAYQSLLTTEGPDGKPAARGYVPPRSLEDLQMLNKAFDLLMRRCGGELGRPPQYLSTSVLGMYCRRDLLKGVKQDYDYIGNVERFLAHCRDNDLCIGAGFTDPSSPRHIPQEAKNVMRMVDKRPDGIIVRGAKAYATLTPLADEYVGMTIPRPGLAPEEILTFAVPVATPGLKIICRESYTKEPAEDYPLSSGFDEPDALVIMDDVFVPADRIFLLYDAAVNAPYHGEIHRAFSHHLAMVRILVKMETMTGICYAITEYQGTKNEPAVVEALAEMVTKVETYRAMIETAERNHLTFGEGWVRANPDVTQIARILGMEWHGRMIDLVTQLCSSSLLIVPSAATLKDPALGALIKRFVTGGDDHAEDRFKMLKLAREYSSSGFARRQLAFEMNSSATLPMNRMGLVRSYDASPLINLAKDLAGIQHPA